MSKANEKMINAKRKMLEAEVELLEEVITDAMHWDNKESARPSLVRIRRLSQEIATALSIGALE